MSRKISWSVAVAVIAVLLPAEGDALDASTCDNAEMYLPGVISLDDSHDFLNWKSDDATLFFVSRASHDFSRSQIARVKFDGEKWHEKILDISTGPYESGLALAPDRSHALFSSTRESSGHEPGTWNIWQSSTLYGEDDVVFEAPTIVPWPINSEHNECCAVFGQPGELYFSSDRNGKWSVYLARYSGRDVDVQRLSGDVNRSDGGTWPSFFERSRNILVFSSIRAGGRGGDDIYFVSQADNAGQLQRPSTDVVNKSGYEDGGRIFGKDFYWSSRPPTTDDRSNEELSSVYAIDADCFLGLTED